jgi:hypothetical protein
MRLETRFWIDDRIYWPIALVTTSNCDSLTELHTPKITVTTSHKVFSVFINRLLGSGTQRRNFPFLWDLELYRFLTSHNGNPQLTILHLKKSKLLCDWRFLPPISSSWRQAPWHSRL